MDGADEFIKGDVTIHVQYSAAKVIDGLAKSGPNNEYLDAGTGDNGLLRNWLTGRRSEVVDRPASATGARVDFDRYPNGWTREEFLDALENPADRAFFLRFLQLVDANSRTPAEGNQPRVFGGNRPGGGLFVYPSGRRHPPYKFFAKDGRLAISGCWSGFPEVKGHPGFSELAAMLDLDENGPASRVPVAGLDPDEVWRVGENVSRSIN